MEDDGHVDTFAGAHGKCFSFIRELLNRAISEESGYTLCDGGFLIN